jgi:hypothetical protein
MCGRQRLEIVGHLVKRGMGDDGARLFVAGIGPATTSRRSHWACIGCSPGGSVGWASSARSSRHRRAGSRRRPAVGAPTPCRTRRGSASVRGGEGHHRALEEIVARFHGLAAPATRYWRSGTDFADAGASEELTFNAQVAVNLGLPMLYVASGHPRSAAEDRVGRRHDAGVNAVRGLVGGGPRRQPGRAERRRGGRGTAPGSRHPRVRDPGCRAARAPTVGEAIAACKAS